MPDWLVVVYDEEDRIIQSWEILDRSETEAEKEAEADVTNFSDAEDWTLCKLRRAVEETRC